MCKCVQAPASSLVPMQAVPYFALHAKQKKKSWGRSLPAWEQSYDGMHADMPSDPRLEGQTSILASQPAFSY